MTEDTSQLERFKAAEVELLELAKALDSPVREEAYRIAILCLAQRSHSLYRAFIELQDGAARVAGRTLIRPMVEINILMRFLAKDPEFHTELWITEGDRQAMALLSDFDRYPHLRERWGDPGVDEEITEAREAAVHGARARACAARLPGVPKQGAVLPSIAQQLPTIDEPGAYEAYVLAYRALGSEIHGGAFAFDVGRFTSHGDGTVSYSDAVSVEDMLGARGLATATFASTLVIASAALELSIASEADELKRRFVGD